MLVSEPQYANAPAPIDVTEFGIVTLSSFPQHQNADSPIDVAHDGSVTDDRELQPINIRVGSVSNFNGNSMLVRELQFSNALSPINVIELDKITFCRFLQL